jgi:Immunoglobulin domain
MPPAYIFWYHNSRMVNYDSGRGVRVQTRGEGEGARTTSRLTLPSASKGDEGNYTCSPSNTDPATVHVFIQEGGYSIDEEIRQTFCDIQKSILAQLQTHSWGSGQDLFLYFVVIVSL